MLESANSKKGLNHGVYMIKTSYDEKYNAVIIEYAGKVNSAQAEQNLLDIPKAVPKHRKGFNLLVDLSELESMDLTIQEQIANAMDLLNAYGVTKVVRVIPDPNKDIGLNILSIFHYSKQVKILTVESRKDAQERLRAL